MELLEIEGKEDVNLVVRMRRGDAVRIVSFIGPMTGTSERIASYTAEEVREKIRRGEDRSRRMQREEALRRRRADPEAPRPYPSWEETITVDLPEPKQQITLRLDADLLRWFRAQGRGYQTLINAVLRGYYEHERRKEPQRQVEDLSVQWWLLAPSLRRLMEAELPELYALARKNATAALQDHDEFEPAEALPETCPYALEQITGDWLP